VISLVIPLYNEAAGVESLLDRCVGTLVSIKQEFEIICVDDGSTDQTLQTLKAYRRKDSRIKIAVLSRNFGHQAAYTAGLSLSRGDLIVMMDGDLQDPPELIAGMLSIMVEKQSDVVYGKRLGQSEKWLKRWVVNVFHKTFRQFSQLPGADHVGNFSMFNRNVLNALLQMTEKHRYIPGMRFFIGFKQDSIEYHRNARGMGHSKMPLLKLIKLALDAIFSFSDIPIKICLYIGLAGVLISLGGIVYSLISKITGIAPFGWSSLMMSIFLWGSIQLLFLGILGEYIFRIYKEIQNRPLYLIREIVE